MIQRNFIYWQINLCAINLYFFFVFILYIYIFFFERFDTRRNRETNKIMLFGVN